MINGAKEDVIAKAQELTGGAGMDLIIETAGTEITTRQAIPYGKEGFHDRSGRLQQER